MVLKTVPIKTNLMETHRQLFTKEMDEQLNLTLIEKQCFEVAYAWENQNQTRAEIITELNKPNRLNGTLSETRLSQIRKDIAKKIYDVYSMEMEADLGDRVYLINNHGKGKLPKGDAPHEVVFNWLWNYKHRRWQVDLAVKPLIERASRQKDWINFYPIDEVQSGNSNKITGHRNPNATKKRDVIEVNKPYCLSLEFSQSHGYFLLLNRGLIGWVFICPSLGFGNNNQVNNSIIVMPQEGTFYEDIFFEDLVKEEFIGIYIDRDLDISWLLSDDEEEIPICTPERIQQLLDSLESTQYQVFYKSFDVV